MKSLTFLIKNSKLSHEALKATTNVNTFSHLMKKIYDLNLNSQNFESQILKSYVYLLEKFDFSIDTKTHYIDLLTQFSCIQQKYPFWTKKVQIFQKKIISKIYQHELQA
jgi:hypothetical protein